MLFSFGGSSFLEVVCFVVDVSVCLVEPLDKRYIARPPEIAIKDRATSKNIFLLRSYIHQ